ncbi:hypothetical protein DM860_010853 [Cuscuta australis]|uniref:Uncharacterized protein n=1 Tax=Cuscuta australis TaxID=267555 RepID=A0A328E4J5_9ASTE|nr:hypothetical protein DM860_010853 [Cuscuta australis]
MCGETAFYDLILANLFARGHHFGQPQPSVPPKKNSSEPLPSSSLCCLRLLRLARRQLPLNIRRPQAPDSASPSHSPQPPICSRDVYKVIVKKAADKVLGALQSRHIPDKPELANEYVSCVQPKLEKLVNVSFMDLENLLFF